MFKKIPHKPRMFGGVPPTFCVRQQVQKGSSLSVGYSFKSAEDAYPPLPSPEVYDLQRQLDAGVPLKEVSSVVFRDTDIPQSVQDMVESMLNESENPNPNDD